jgi:hypothetical protein
LQNVREFWPGFIFQRINPWTGSMPPWTGRARSVYRGPTAAWTEGGGGGRGGTLPEARPPAAPVHQSSPAGEQKGDRSMGSSAWASPELERRRSDRATAVSRRGHGKLGGEGFWRGRGEEKGAMRCGVLRGSSGWLL